YGPSPDLLTTPALDGSTGDAQHPNRFAFYLDAADAPGSYPIAAFSNVYSAIANGGGLSTDYLAADGGSGAFTRRFVAVSGTVQVTEVLTPHQTTRTLSTVRFAEATYGSD